jgi:Tfp pilus assembly protein FimV
MVLRVWAVWGALLASSIGISLAKPTVLVPPNDDGKATPPLTTDHHQAETAPTPRTMPSVSKLDLDAPIRSYRFGRSKNPGAQLAFEIAEMHLDAGDRNEANEWFEEVIRQAPESDLAKTATERLAKFRSQTITDR